MHAGSTTPVRVHNLELSVQESAAATSALRRVAARRLGLPEGALGDATILRRALDARHRAPRYSYSIEVRLEARLATRLLRQGRVEPSRPVLHRRWRLRTAPDGPAPVVVGAGPAGLFAALTLAEAGWAPILLERGRPVEPRARDVSKLYSQGVLDPESNVCFGEGGAGTFSDGKLYTRVGDARVEHVMGQLVAFGANPSILVDNRPHLGTDRLVALLKAMRARLADLGVVYRFGTALDDFHLAAGSLRALTLVSGERLDAPHAILATGHSARGVWERLHARGLPLESRPFAVGFRVEHPQAMIDAARYGNDATGLPAADYRLTYNERGDAPRGVYSFCMCPGGVVVTTPTEPDRLCINGMSHASRRGRFANSALVVSVTPEDFAAAGHRGVFAGAAFQDAAERAAYEAGGGAFVAPACRVSDFAAGRVSTDLGATSYRRGLWPADLSALYPAPVVAALRRALGSFDRKLRGFVTEEATLIGVETRTAAPVRLPRGDDLQAVGAAGLYPAGEGLGYGGGIVSAAVDGVRAAEALLERAGAVAEVYGPETGAA
jgi:uncharacterized FAD-dependent dehydrogenase